GARSASPLRPSTCPQASRRALTPPRPRKYLSVMNSGVKETFIDPGQATPPAAPPAPPPPAALAAKVRTLAPTTTRSMQRVADTAAALDVTQLEASVAALASARRIDVYGIGASNLVAQDLVQKLLRIGLIAHAHSDPHLAVTNAVQMRARDVAIAITHSGRTT